jgi:hypothetical protein
MPRHAHTSRPRPVGASKAEREMSNRELACSTTPDTVLEPQSPSTVLSPQPTTATPAQWSTRDVLALQRSVGNQAVVRLLAATGYQSSIHVGLSSPAARQVIQREWKCSGCGKTGPGKPKGRCPECGSRDLEEVTKKLSFGDWWERLDEDRKQQLLRAHGTHESAGGAQQKAKGGGPKKGNQHDTGVATAKKAIKEEYENGDYD